MRGVSRSSRRWRIPVWSMGAKISVDSATLMNKGLELIEAARLFPVPPERIEIILHRQSVIHSLVEYVDGSMLAQLGSPDMRTPIAHTLAWPDRMETPVRAAGSGGDRPARFRRTRPGPLPGTAAGAGGARCRRGAAGHPQRGERGGGRRISGPAHRASSKSPQLWKRRCERYDPPAPGRIEDVIAIDPRGPLPRRRGDEGVRRLSQRSRSAADHRSLFWP